MSQFTPKTVIDIRRKRLELYQAAQQATGRRQTIWLPGSDPEQEQSPDLLMFGAMTLAWVLGEEMVPPHRWDHTTPHARGWARIPVESQEYTEKPDWCKHGVAYAEFCPACHAGL